MSSRLPPVAPDAHSTASDQPIQGWATVAGPICWSNASTISVDTKKKDCNSPRKSAQVIFLRDRHEISYSFQSSPTRDAVNSSTPRGTRPGGVGSWRVRHQKRCVRRGIDWCPSLIWRSTASGSEAFQRIESTSVGRCRSAIGECSLRWRARARRASITPGRTSLPRDAGQQQPRGAVRPRRARPGAPLVGDHRQAGEVSRAKSRPAATSLPATAAPDTLAPTQAPGLRAAAEAAPAQMAMSLPYQRCSSSDVGQTCSQTAGPGRT